MNELAARNAALFALLELEARPAEISRAALADFRGASLELGRGRRRRALELSPEARGALWRWIGLRGREPGPLFVAGRLDRRLRTDRAPMSRFAVCALRARARGAA